MNLIRFAGWVFSWLGEKKCIFQRRFEGSSGRNVTFEMSGYGGNYLNLSASSHGDVTGHGERYSNDPIQMGDGRRAIKVDDGHGRGCDGDFSPVGQINKSVADVSDYGVWVGHGSYNLFSGTIPKVAWFRSGCRIQLAPTHSLFSPPAQEAPRQPTEILPSEVDDTSDACQLRP